jgi:hypothetical protein
MKEGDNMKKRKINSQWGIVVEKGDWVTRQLGDASIEGTVYQL